MIIKGNKDLEEMTKEEVTECFEKNLEKTSVWKTIDKGYTKIAAKSTIVGFLHSILHNEETKEEMAERNRTLIKERTKNAILVDFYTGYNGRPIIRQNNQI